MISVIICTYNRADSLKVTLNSFVAQKNTHLLQYEIILVDNNSSDSTRGVAESYAPKFNGKLKYIFEPKQGLSFARNRGIKESRGDVIAFTDDDCIVEKEWIHNIQLAFAHTACDCVFGKILPVWPTASVPQWIGCDKRLWYILAILDYGDVKKRIEAPEKPFFGANFAFRRACIANDNVFNTSLGRKGDRLFCGEDSELFHRFLSAKKCIVYDPCITVGHNISKERIKKRYFRKRQYDTGLSYACNLPACDKSIFGVPLWYMKETLGHFTRYLFAVLSLRRKKIFYYELKCVTALGAIKGCFGRKAKSATV